MFDTHQARDAHCQSKFPIAFGVDQRKKRLTEQCGCSSWRICFQEDLYVASLFNAGSLRVFIYTMSNEYGVFIGRVYPRHLYYVSAKKTLTTVTAKTRQISLSNRAPRRVACSDSLRTVIVVTGAASLFVLIPTKPMTSWLKRRLSVQ